MLAYELASGMDDKIKHDPRSKRNGRAVGFVGGRSS
jgi:hypothetical protein